MFARIGFAVVLAGLVATPALAQTPVNVEQPVRFRAVRDSAAVVVAPAVRADAVSQAMDLFRLTLDRGSSAQLQDLGGCCKGLVMWQAVQLDDLGSCYCIRPRGLPMP